MDIDLNSLGYFTTLNLECVARKIFVYNEFITMNIERHNNTQIDKHKHKKIGHYLSPEICCFPTNLAVNSLTLTTPHSTDKCLNEQRILGHYYLRTTK